MLEDLVLVKLSLRFVEVVHVKLSYKRGEVVVEEILWEHLFRKSSLIFNEERGAIRSPLDDIGQISSLQNLKNFEKKRRNTLAISFP